MLAADDRHLRLVPAHLRRRGAGRAGDHDRLRAAALVATRPRGRARGALPARLVDGPPARRGDHRADRPRADHGRLLRGRSHPSRGSARGARAGAADRARRARARLAAVHRRGPFRDPRHRAQPGHVAAPVRGRPAARWGRRAADLAGLSARPALDRRAVSALGPSTVARLRRAHPGGRGRRLRRAAGPARAAPARGGAPSGRWWSGSPTWSPPTWSRGRSRRRWRRSSCSPSRSPCASSPGARPEPAGGVHPRGAAARRARDRQRLRLQLPGPALARRRVRRLGGARARAGLAPRGDRRRARRGPRRLPGDRSPPSRCSSSRSRPRSGA